MKSKQPLSKLKRTIGASLAAVALLATTACDADKATNPQSGGIDGAREAIERFKPTMHWRNGSPTNTQVASVSE